MCFSGTLFFEMASILYQIRYLLRSYFDKKKDKKLLNVNHGDVGLRLHELAVQFSLMYPIEVRFEISKSLEKEFLYLKENSAE